MLPQRVQQAYPGLDAQRMRLAVYDEDSRSSLRPAFGHRQYNIGAHLAHHGFPSLVRFTRRGGDAVVAGVQVTMCTSSPPPCRMTRDVMLATGRSATRQVRGVVPRTSWVALFRSEEHTSELQSQ